MRSRVWLSLLSVTALVSLPALAQEEELAPLPPMKKVEPRKKAPPAAKKAPRAAPKKVDPEELAPLPPAVKGELVVKSTLANAVLLIDGKEVGPLPIGPQLLPVGEHTVLVKRPGYANFTRKVTVVGGKSIDVEAKLAPVTAVLSVVSSVEGAQVFIDGKLIGTAPITGLELPAKSVEIVVRREGYLEQKRSLSLVAGKDYPVSVTFTPTAATTLIATKTDRPVTTALTPTTTSDVPVTTVTSSAGPPIYGRWYFWAGVAVVVAAAAGTAAAVAINNNQPPRQLTQKDFICEGQPCKLDGCIGLQCTISAAVPWAGNGAVHW